MTTLILGGSGQLGTEFRRLLPDAAAPSHVEFDLSRATEIQERVQEIRPDRIINCAAYTAVDAAEDDEDSAVVINGVAVGELAAVADSLGIPFVTFSTDYVFDGEATEPYVESSLPSPLNTYGRSKLEGERLSLQYPGSLVIRSSWLLSATHANFATAILAKAAGPMQVVDDQLGRPTLVPDLAGTIVAALDDGLSGVLHAASPPTTTWFGLARAVLAAAGIDPAQLVSCSTEQYSPRAPRPRFSALASERIAPLPDWRDGLAELVAQIVAPPSSSGLRPNDPPSRGRLL